MYGIANIVFVICASLGALLVAVPLPKALASGDVGTLMLIVWTGVACLVQIVNAILWNQNIKNWAPAWCDFCGYFLIVTDVSLAASGLSIIRRLYIIVTLDPMRHEKTLNAVVDTVLCLVIPWASAALLYVVRQYRFYIFEDIGCTSGIGAVDLTFPLVWMLPLLVGTISAGYAFLTIRANSRRNHQLMGDSGASSAWSRRLMALGIVSTLYELVPTSISIALSAITDPEWQSNSTRIVSVELRRWTIVTLAFVVFAFLGLTSDMKRMYRMPDRNVIEQTLSADRTGIRAVHGPDTDGDLIDQRLPRLSRFRQNRFQQDDLDLTDRSRLDSDVEGFQLVVPLSRPPAATHSTHSPWTPHCEGGGYPAHT